MSQAKDGGKIQGCLFLPLKDVSYRWSETQMKIVGHPQGKKTKAYGWMPWKLLCIWSGKDKGFPKANPCFSCMFYLLTEVVGFKQPLIFSWIGPSLVIDHFEPIVFLIDKIEH